MQTNPVLQKPPLSLGGWLLTVFLIHLPVIGFILAIIWAVDSSGDPGRQRYAQATLIFTVLMIVLAGLFFVTVFTTLEPYFKNYNTI